MDSVQLGRSGLKVSPVCLGTMMFGGAADEAASRRIIDKARGFGINFIDTADVYNSGASEEIVGRAIAADRDHWIVATKVGSPARWRRERGRASGASARSCARRKRARNGCKPTASIFIICTRKTTRRRWTKPSARSPSSCAAVSSARFGVSNYRGWRVADICRLCDTLGIARPIVSQPYYNALNRMPEVEHLPACAHYGLGVFPYSPIARGVLTGKYLAGEKPPAEFARRRAATSGSCKPSGGRN